MGWLCLFVATLFFIICVIVGRIILNLKEENLQMETGVQCYISGKVDQRLILMAETGGLEINFLRCRQTECRHKTCSEELWKKLQIFDINLLNNKFM